MLVQAGNVLDTSANAGSLALGGRSPDSTELSGEGC